ncbi:MAG: YaiO family outer membrane beta-barrel protein [Terriglobales bacterium]
MKTKKTVVLKMILRIGILFFACLLSCAIARAQTNSNTTTAPGSSLPGLGVLNLGLEGPGFVEVGYGHSALSGDNSDWNDVYLRGSVSGGRNVFNGELNHDDRFGDSGWYGGLGWTRTLSENWFAQVSAGASVGGFFLPRFRTDGLINRKLLRRRQLVVTAGVGFDQSKTVDNDIRGQAGAAYYFEKYPVVLQGGLTWTHANPGDILARTQYIAATQGHDKEHFFSLRYEWGREGYEVIGPPTAQAPAFNVALDFPEHTVAGTWRQWIGPNWGLNFNVEQHQEPAYHRLGGTVGVFLDF